MKTDTDTVSDVMLARLAALIERHHGGSVRALERDMGRANNWLRRKLQGDRPMTLADLDLVLTHLGQPHGALLEPTNTTEDT